MRLGLACKFKIPAVFKVYFFKVIFRYCDNKSFYFIVMYCAVLAVVVPIKKKEQMKSDMMSLYS